MNEPVELTLEQQFTLRSFADQVKQMSHEQAQEFLIMLHKHMMTRELMYQQFLRHEWKLD